MNEFDHKKLLKTLDSFKAMALAYCLDATDEGEARNRAEFVRGRLHFFLDSDGLPVYGAYSKGPIHGPDGLREGMPIEGVGEFLRKKLIELQGWSDDPNGQEVTLRCPKSAPYRCDDECSASPC